VLPTVIAKSLIGDRGGYGNRDRAVGMGRCADARLVLHRCERHARFCTGRFAQSWTIAATALLAIVTLSALVATTCFGSI